MFLACHVKSTNQQLILVAGVLRTLNLLTLKLEKNIPILLAFGSKVGVYPAATSDGPSGTCQRITLVFENKGKLYSQSSRPYALTDIK